MTLPLSLLTLTRDDAREAAREELQRRQYQDAKPPALQRAIGRATRWVGGRLQDAAGGLDGSGIAQVLLVAVLVVVAVMVLVRLGPTASNRTRKAVFDDLEARTAAEHRAAAEALAARGELAGAVRERLRAVVRELEVRGVLDPRPGRTAGEVARDAGVSVPALAVGLRRGARVFDEVWYGRRVAVRADYDALVAVDDEVRGTRAVPA